MGLSARLLRVVRPAFIAGAIVLALSGNTATGATTAEQAVGAAQVKAAFLFNFTKFVQWPTPTSDPLVIGIAGDDAFAGIVSETVRGRRVDGRELQARRLAAGDDPSGCQVVYVSGVKAQAEAEWMGRIRGPVLTVGESAPFLRAGGMIRFYIENSNVRFQINQKNAEVTGLKLHAQLLKLAAR